MSKHTRYRQRKLAEDPDWERKRMADYRRRHPENNAAACRRHYEKHRERELERKRRYYREVRKKRDATSEGRLRDRLKKQARRRQAQGSLSAADWRSVLDEHAHRCAWCGVRSVPLEIDHVIPLTKGGEHGASNVVPACKPCNSSRGNLHDRPPRLE